MKIQQSRSLAINFILTRVSASLQDPPRVLFCDLFLAFLGMVGFLSPSVLGIFQVHRSVFCVFLPIGLRQPAPWHLLCAVAHPTELIAFSCIDLPHRISSTFDMLGLSRQ